MQKNLPTILISTLTALVIIGLFVFAFSQSSNNSTPANSTGSPIAVGKAPPSFSLKDLQNNEVAFNPNTLTKPVLIEFFAIWCPHCQHMAPIVEDLWSQYQNKGIQFYSIQANQYGKNYESSGGTDTTKATISDLDWFRDTFSIKYPILQDYSIATANAYGVQGYPTFYIINKQGKVTYTTSGEVSESTLADQINKVI